MAGKADAVAPSGPAADVTPGAQPPVEEEPLKVRRPPKGAGGVDSIVAAMGQALGKMTVPTAAKALLTVNQHDGFDCPGCAWPDPKRPMPVEFCENGAKAVADEAMSARITPAFFEAHSIPDLLARSDYWLGRQGRLTHPMIREEGSDRYVPLGWDAAFKLIGEELNQLQSPDEAVFYTSGRTSNEAAFLYQLFVRQFGTNNLPDCSNMCHESSGRGLGEVIGVGKGTVTLEDFDQADLILVIGQNPGTNHPRMLSTLQAAARRGARIISINPLDEPGLRRFTHPQDIHALALPGRPIAERVVQLKVGSDVAVLKGLMKGLLELEDANPGTVLDHAFIAEFTDGFDAFADDIRRTVWGEVVEASGVHKQELLEIAQAVADSKAMICCWAMGVTQHKNGVGNVQSIANLLLMGGHMGRPGAGACPVRGHSNVQGDRTMGIWERPTAAFLDRLATTFNFDPPRHHGLDTVGAIKAMHSGEAKVFIAMGGNFLSATPDTEFTAKAMARCRLTVQISTKLNRSHLITGRRALILPCLGRTEADVQSGVAQLVTVENSMGVVHSSRGHLSPASKHLLSEPVIVARMATATLGPRSTVDWEALTERYERIRDAIAATIPGFEEMNHRISQPGGFGLPNAARDRVFNTKTGKARFTVHPIPHINLEPGQLLMMTLRSHDQYNTTIYGLDDRYRGIKGGRRIILIAHEDIIERGLQEGQAVDIHSHYNGEVRVAERFVLVPFAMPRSCVATYFPETNVLVPVDSFADKSRTPTSKSIIVTLHSRA